MPEEKKKSFIRKYWFLIFLLFFVYFYFFDRPFSNEDSTVNNLPKFDPEVTNIGTSPTMYHIINKNDYPWHNVKIIINGEYSCWSRDILEPEDFITINAITCNQFAVNYNLVESIWVISDEGTERRSLI
jgi:hypothetical protein